MTDEKFLKILKLKLMSNTIRIKDLERENTSLKLRQEYLIKQVAQQIKDKIS